jgi:hypothetical protein
MLIFSLFSTKIFGQNELKEKEENVIVVNSVPEGAEVFINGESKGFTPLNLKDFKIRKFVIVVQHKDFKKVEQTVVYKSGKRELFFVLDGDYGFLSINTDPQGAKIKINNQEYGLTPLSDIKLPLGANKVEFAKENYDYLTKTVYINKTKQSVNPKLKYSYSYVSLSNLNNDSKQEIYIDDKIEANALSKELRLKYGEHKIKITTPYFHKAMSADYTFVEEMKYKFNYRYNIFTLKYAIYSALVPGLGQFLDNSQIKGVLLCAATIANTFLIVSTDRMYREKVDEYNNNLVKYKIAVKEDDVLKYRSLVKENEGDANNLNKRKNYLIAALAGIYVLNLVDVILFHTKDYEFTLMPAANTESASLNIMQFKIKL